MHDIRAIRENPDAFDAAMARRGAVPLSSQIMQLDSDRRDLVGRLQELQTRRNAVSKEIGQLMKAGKADEAAQLRADISAAMDEVFKKDLATTEDGIKKILESLPNTLDADVPDGADETANVVLATHGTPRDLGFEPKQHFEIGEALGMMTSRPPPSSPARASSSTRAR